MIPGERPAAFGVQRDVPASGFPMGTNIHIRTIFQAAHAGSPP